MNKKRIIRVMADELDKLEGKTDWSRVDKMSDADIRRAMRDDPDWSDDLDIDWNRAEIVRPRVKRLQPVVFLGVEVVGGDRAPARKAPVR